MNIINYWLIIKTKNRFSNAKCCFCLSECRLRSYLNLVFRGWYFKSYTFSGWTSWSREIAQRGCESLCVGGPSKPQGFSSVVTRSRLWCWDWLIQYAMLKASRLDKNIREGEDCYCHDMSLLFYCFLLFALTWTSFYDSSLLCCPALKLANYRLETSTNWNLYKLTLSTNIYRINIWCPGGILANGLDKLSAFLNLYSRRKHNIINVTMFTTEPHNTNDRRISK